MKAKLFFLVAILSIVTSCGSYKLTSKKYVPATTLENGELLYYLPKTVLQLKVTYSETVVTTFKNGIPSNAEPIYKVKGIEITPVLVNDESRAFVAKSTNPSTMLSENTNFKFNKYGVIQNLQTDYTDKTLDVVSNTLKGVVSIVKTIYAAAGEEDFKVKINTKIVAANSALIAAIAANNSNDIKKHKDQLSSYYELLKQYLENNKVVKTETEIKYEFIKDPVFNSDINVATGIGGMPAVTLKLTSLNNTGLASVTYDTQTNAIQTPNTVSDGLLYAIPKVCSVKATLTSRDGTITIFDNIISFPQFGDIKSISVESKRYTNKKTAVEFDPASGALTSVHTESGSSSENLSKSFAESAQLLQSTATELKYDIKIANLKKEKELKDLEDSLKDKPQTTAEDMQNEVELLKLKLELEKLKKALAELGQGN